MNVALAGRPPATFEIKSATLPLVSFLLKSHDLQALAVELQGRFGDLPDFFDDDPLVIDLSLLQADVAVDFAGLITLLRAYRLMPVAVRGGSKATMANARTDGLARADEAVIAAPRRAEPKAAPAVEAPAAAPVAPLPRAAPPPSGALLIDKPIRSGQQVVARGRDLVLMAMVNPGAEVIADGSIHVYAPLRGKAIAGARGNVEARILSLCLEPELLSIAGVYRTSEVALPADLLGQPTQVRLEGGRDGKLVMERLDLTASPSGRGRG